MRTRRRPMASAARASSISSRSAAAAGRSQPRSHCTARTAVTCRSWMAASASRQGAGSIVVMAGSPGGCRRAGGPGAGRRCRPPGRWPGLGFRRRQGAGGQPGGGVKDAGRQAGQERAELAVGFTGGQRGQAAGDRQHARGRALVWLDRGHRHAPGERRGRGADLAPQVARVASVPDRPDECAHRLLAGGEVAVGGEGAQVRAEQLRVGGELGPDQLGRMGPPHIAERGDRPDRDEGPDPVELPDVPKRFFRGLGRGPVRRCPGRTALRAGRPGPNRRPSSSRGTSSRSRSHTPGTCPAAWCGPWNSVKPPIHASTDAASVSGVPMSVTPAA